MTWRHWKPENLLKSLLSHSSYHLLRWVFGPSKFAFVIVLFYLPLPEVYVKYNLYTLYNKITWNEWKNIKKYTLYTQVYITIYYIACIMYIVYIYVCMYVHKVVYYNNIIYSVIIYIYTYRPIGRRAWEKPTAVAYD